MSSAFSLHRTTPFPNALLDQVMPSLTDTEWRLLCVVVRQTRGWRHGENGRKDRDWLTHSQLKLRTGRASEAISRAIDSLIRQRLIEVCDEQGYALPTAAARRRYAGRLYYRLGAAVLEAESEMPESEVNISPNEIRKAKTTKETESKLLPDGNAEQVTGTGNQGISAEKKRTSKGPESEVHRFLRLYRDKFRRRTMHEEPPVINWGKDSKLVKQLLRLYSFERLGELLEQFFSMEDEWLQRQGYSLYAFKTSLGRLLVTKMRADSSFRHSRLSSSTRSTGWNHVGKIRKVHTR